MSDETPKSGNVSVRTMSNSVIQQNSPGAIASIRIISDQEKATLEQILSQVVALIESLSLTTDDKDEMKEDIKVLEDQLRRKRPKAGIISTCLRSILSKLTSAATGPLATTVAAGVQWSIDKISTVLGSM